MRLRALGERLTGGGGVVRTVLVVELDAPLLHCDQHDPGMTLPPGVTARADDEVLEKELGLALVFELDRPGAADVGALFDPVQRGPLGNDHVGDNARRRRAEGKSRSNNSTSE